MGVSASGCHHNVSLWRGGEGQVNKLGNDTLPGLPGTFTYLKGGENLFMPDPSIDARKPGPVGLQCVGGVIKNLAALTSIGSSTVNSRSSPIGAIRTGPAPCGYPPRAASSTARSIAW
jgi:glutamine synthetase